jgi:hypothetical protein
MGDGLTGGIGAAVEPTLDVRHHVLLGLAVLQARAGVLDQVPALGGGPQVGLGRLWLDGHLADDLLGHLGLPRQVGRRHLGPDMGLLELAFRLLHRGPGADHPVARRLVGQPPGVQLGVRMVDGIDGLLEPLLGTGQAAFPFGLAGLGVHGPDPDLTLDLGFRLLAGAAGVPLVAGEVQQELALKRPDLVRRVGWRRLGPARPLLRRLAEPCLDVADHVVDGAGLGGGGAGGGEHGRQAAEGKDGNEGPGTPPASGHRQPRDRGIEGWTSAPGRR